MVYHKVQNSGPLLFKINSLKSSTHVCLVDFTIGHLYLAAEIQSPYTSDLLIISFYQLNSTEIGTITAFLVYCLMNIWNFMITLSHYTTCDLEIIWTSLLIYSKSSCYFCIGALKPKLMIPMQCTANVMFCNTDFLKINFLFKFYIFMCKD